MNENTPIKKHGGARVGGGRKKFTEEQKFQVNQAKRKVMLDELLFPAVVTAFHSDPGQWKDRYLQVELSKKQIKLAYGAEGLKEWMSYFTCTKIGGRDRFGIGYKTRWSMNLNKYMFILQLIESMGHTPKDLPTVWFPPVAMLKRLEAIDLKRKKKEPK